MTRESASRTSARRHLLPGLSVGRRASLRAALSRQLYKRALLATLLLTLAVAGTRVRGFAPERVHAELPHLAASGDAADPSDAPIASLSSALSGQDDAPTDEPSEGAVSYFPLVLLGLSSPTPPPLCFVRKAADEGNDGIVDSAWRFLVRPDGQLAASWSDADADGRWDSSSKLSYDVSGRLLRIDIDNTNDGSADSTRLFAYDGAGRRIRAEWDKDADGEADAITSWEYGARGLLVAELYDSNGDGNTDLSFSFHYDELDRCVTIEEYTGAFAALIRLRTAVWSGAVRTALLIDDGADGVVDREFRWLFDDGSRLIRYEKWSGGSLDFWYAYEYNEAGRRNAEYFYTSDGALEDEWHYSYDSVGRVVRQIYSSAIYPPVTTTWEYGRSCPATISLDPAT